MPTVTFRRNDAISTHSAIPLEGQHPHLTTHLERGNPFRDRFSQCFGNLVIVVRHSHSPHTPLRQTNTRKRASPTSSKNKRKITWLRARCPNPRWRLGEPLGPCVFQHRIRYSAVSNWYKFGVFFFRAVLASNSRVGYITLEEPEIL